MTALAWLGFLATVALVAGAVWGAHTLGYRQGRAKGLEDRCEHVWKITSVARYQPGGSVSGFVSPGLESRIMYGATVLGEQCQGRCKEVRSRTLRGLVTIPGWS